MPHCAVSKCFSNSRNSPGLSFFSFPKINQSEWLRRCARKNEINIKIARVCGRHFLDDDLDDSYKIQRSVMPTHVKLKRKLKIGAVPSINLPSTFSSSLSLNDDDDGDPRERRRNNDERRDERQGRRDRKELVSQLLQDHERKQQAVRDNPDAEPEIDPIDQLKIKAGIKKPPVPARPDGSTTESASPAAADASYDDWPAFADDGGAASAGSDAEPAASIGGAQMSADLVRSPCRSFKGTAFKVVMAKRSSRPSRRKRNTVMVVRTKEILRLKMRVRRLEARCLRVLNGAAADPPPAANNGDGDDQPPEQETAGDGPHHGAGADAPRTEGVPSAAGRQLDEQPLVILRNDPSSKLPPVLKQVRANQLSDSLATFMPSNLGEAQEVNHRLKLQLLNLQAVMLKWAIKNRQMRDARLKREREEIDETAARGPRLRELLRLEAAVKGMFTEAQIRHIVRSHEDSSGVPTEKRRWIPWGEEDLLRMLELRAISSDKVIDHVREKMKIPLPTLKTAKLRCTKSPSLSEAYVEMLRKREENLNICSMCEGQVKTIDNVIDGANGDDGGGPDVDGEALFGRSFMQLVSERESRHSAGTKPKKRRSAGATATSGAKKRRQSTAALDWPGTSDSDAELSDPGMWGRIPAARPSWQPDLISSVSTGREPPPPDPLAARHLHKSWR